MTATTPRQIHELFSRHFIAGDVDAIIALYEPGGVLLPEPGRIVRGHAAVRESLGAFIALKGTFRLEPGKVIEAGDLALIFADWTLEATAADGSPIRLAGQTSDVVRRQPDGRWLFVIDNPFGAAGV